jgi:hypothetical protein
MIIFFDQFAARLRTGNCEMDTIAKGRFIFYRQKAIQEFSGAHHENISDMKPGLLEHLRS